MIYNVKVDETDYKLEIIEGDGNLEVRLNGRIIKIDDRNLAGGRMDLILQDNVPYEMELSKNSEGYYCWLNSRMATCEVVDEKTARFARLMGASIDGKKGDVLKAPMPGLVVRVDVTAGQEIKKGDGLVIVEAMKMENELKAGSPGKVKSVKVEQGQAVEKNQVLIEFE